MSKINVYPFSGFTLTIKMKMDDDPETSSTNSGNVKVDLVKEYVENNFKTPRIM